MLYTKNVRVWVRSIPVHEQLAHFIGMMVAIALWFGMCVFLWRLGFFGGIMVGFCLLKLLR